MTNNESTEELEALISYLVNHNESHTKELEDLAISLKSSGNLDAYNEVMDAIKEYKKGNEKLSSSLKKLSK